MLSSPLLFIAGQISYTNKDGECLLVVAFCLFKYFPYGGLQRDFYRIANEVASRGHSVRVYTRQWEGRQPENFEVILVPTHSLSNAGKNTQYYQWVRAHLDQHPVDKVVGFNRMPGLDVYFAADVCYAESHKNDSVFYKLTPRYRQFIAYEKSVFAKGLKTKILLLTQNSQTVFQQHYQTESDRFFLLPPGIDRSRRYDRQPPDSRRKFREKFNLSLKQKLILQVCSNYELKGVDRTIHALASLPKEVKDETFLFIVGEDDSKKLASLAQKLGVQNHVRFFSGRDDIPQFMLGADILLHPARKEAAGIVILEAIVSCLPIIVSGLCGYCHYVNQANAGIVLPEPFKQELYNQVLYETLQNEIQLKQWGQNAKRFTDHYDLYSLANRAADIILDEE